MSRSHVILRGSIISLTYGKFIVITAQQELSDILLTNVIHLINRDDGDDDVSERSGASNDYAAIDA